MSNIYEPAADNEGSPKFDLGDEVVITAGLYAHDVVTILSIEFKLDGKFLGYTVKWPDGRASSYIYPESWLRANE